MPMLVCEDPGTCSWIGRDTSNHESGMQLPKLRYGNITQMKSTCTRKFGANWPYRTTELSIGPSRPAQYGGKGWAEVVGLDKGSTEEVIEHLEDAACT
jgi:hypothetical protein